MGARAKKVAKKKSSSPTRKAVKHTRTKPSGTSAGGVKATAATANGGRTNVANQAYKAVGSVIPAKVGAAKEARTWDVAGVVTWLKAHSSRQVLEGMARYAIPSANALGVAMKDMKALGKLIGRDHALALLLWDTGIYEARMVAGFVADPNELTAKQMETWCRDFDNWAYCDTICFNLFDRSPQAWNKVFEWSTREKEFEKRTAFALLWSLALHDKHSTDATFVDALALVERAASDERNFVKKAVAMALKAVGKRNAALRAPAKAVAARLASSDDVTARWIGKDALKEL